MSERDIGSAMAANKAWQDLDTSAKGFWNSISVMVSPAVRQLSLDIADLSAKRQADSKLQEQAESKNQRYTSFLYELGKNYLHANFGGDFGRAFDFQGAYDRALKSQLDSRKVAAALLKAAQDAAVKQNHDKDISDSTTKLQEQIVAITDGADAAERLRKKIDGWTDGEIRGLKVLQDRKAAVEEMTKKYKDMEGLSSRLQTATQSPRTAFINEIADIEEAVKAMKMPAFVGDRASVAAFEKMAQSIGANHEPVLPKALTYGSAEEANFTNKAMLDDRNNDPQKRVEQVLQEAKRIQQETAKNTAATADALKKLKVVDFN